MSENRELENLLREDWKNWNREAHQDDQMSFIDYVDEIDEYKGHRVSLDRDRWGDYRILFS